MATAAPEVPVLARDAAFERMYRRYVQDVYRYALALLRNPADAEDVTQTTFMNAYRAMQRGEQPRKPQNWLIKIAHNAARTRYARSSRRVKEVPLEDHVDTLPMPDEEKPDLREVLDALGRLPLNQRAALVMRELEGRSYAEIAETIGVSVPAVETLIFRARRSLKLKASNLRVLGLVPLPQSLAQLFDGGGAVAGGTAALGSGFLLKAAVAVVAGALATGITGGGHGPTASAARGPAPTPAASKAGTGALAPAGDRLSAAVQVLRSGGSNQRPAPAGPHRHRPAVEVGGKPGVAATGAAAAGTAAPASRHPAPTVATTVATTVTNVVQQVADTVPVVNQVASSLPVAVPQVPTPPALPVPPPLPLPSVPGLPQVPGLP